MSRSEIKFKKVNPDFGASLGTQGETVKVGKLTLISRSDNPVTKKNQWKDSHVCVLDLEHRKEHLLTNDRRIMGAYETLKEKSKNVPALIVDENGNETDNGFYNDAFNGELVNGVLKLSVR